MHFVFIPAGEFSMGSPNDEKDRHDNEGPVHKVEISKPFYMGKYEVTQAEWKKVTGNSPSHFKGDNNPVEQVSWDDCQDFLKKLNEGVGSKALQRLGGDERGAETPHYELALPTEVQWEYTCRAGTQTRFSFGDREEDLGEYAWYRGNSDGKTPHPVGGKKPNAWGLYDMHGNVWEWCSDWYASYASGSVTDPVGATSGEFRVARGGSWSYAARHSRAAFRGRCGPGNRNAYLGLRLALPVVQR
jgi:formylglycine-generating enzyme required for sulfatase activity